MVTARYLRDDTQLTVVDWSGDVVLWDRFVCASEGATFCHLAGWRDILSDVLGHDCLYRVAVDRRGDWQGVLPLARVKSFLFGHYLMSLPILSYGGPVGCQASATALIEWAVAEAERSRVDLLELRTPRPIPNELGVSNRKVTMVLTLPGTTEELWANVFRSKLRSQIRRPKKEGMEVRFGAEHTEAFYEVYSRKMRDLGTPVLPLAFFERIARVFGETAVFAAVYWQDRPVAGGCGFVWADEFEITWAASLTEFNRYAPNMLLYCALMEEMIRRGIAVFNFGRCTPGSGTHRFKQQWGGEEVSLPWVQWSPAGRAEIPSQDGRVYSLATAVWQRLPLFVANHLGPRLARRLP